MKRSANGTGTIYKRKGVSKPYIVYGRAYNENGVMKREYLGAFKTRKEAEERRVAYIVNPEIKKTDLTFGDIFIEYKSTARYKALSKSAKDVYHSSYKHCSTLYALRFADIRTAQFQTVIDSVAEKGFSQSTVQKVKLLFTLLSNYALQNDIITKSYAEFVVLPKFEQTEKRAFTDEEIRKITESAYKGSRAAQWVLFLIFSGWRIGELLELTAEDYDASEQSFKGGKKTAAGKNRVVPVHSKLQWIVDSQLRQKGKTVFCMPSGKPMTSNYFRKSIFNPLMEELGIDNELTPHNTRHTFATKLKQAGADDFYRKKLLGHSCKGVTDEVYTHADIDNLRKTIELLEVNNVCSLYAVC